MSSLSGLVCRLSLSDSARIEEAKSCGWLMEAVTRSTCPNCAKTSPRQPDQGDSGNSSIFCFHVRISARKML
jgi:hypothetical protein